MNQQSRQWWLRALCLVAIGALVATAVRAEELRLQVQLDGKWEDVQGMADHKLCVGSAAQPKKLPETAEFRLVGDLAANWESLQTTPGYSIGVESAPTEPGGAPQWRVRVLPEFGNSFAAVTQSKKKAIPVWEVQDPARAVCVMAWVVDGVAERLCVRGLVAYPNGAVGVKDWNWLAGEPMMRGNPVALVIEQGRVVQPRAEFTDPAANEIAALAALGRDDEAAARVGKLARPDDRGVRGATLGHWVARAGAGKTLAQLAARGANLAATTGTKETALHWAASCGRVTAVEALLNAKVSSQVADQIDDQPLHYACRNGHLAVVRALLGRGAAVDRENRFGASPVRLAIEANHAQVFAALMERNARFNVSGSDADRLLAEKAGAGQRALVQALLQKKISPNTNLRGTTPLIAAAREGHAGIVQDLLAAGAKVNELNYRGATALILAAGRKHEAAAALLLAAGANPRLADQAKMTALHSACFAGSTGVVRRLLEAGVPSDEPSSGGFTPLTFALASGSSEAVDLLLARGVAVNPKARLFPSQLGTALAMDSSAFIAAALQAGMSPDLVLADRWPLLRVAQLLRAERCGELLRNAGANTSPVAQGPEVAAASQLQERPKVLKMRAPSDPREPEESDFQETTVEVEVMIDETGQPLFPRATCQDCRLAQTAVRAVAASLFAPATSGGKPVATWAKIPLRFVDRSSVVFEVGNLDVKPKVTKAEAPTYPFEMQSRGIEGAVVVNFIVDEKGRVRDPYVVQSTHSIFERPALVALSEWVFSPGMRDGKPVSTRMQMPIAFKIQSR